MSDISSTLRTQEAQERIHAQSARTQGLAVLSPQAVFPEDRVELSTSAQRVVSGGSDAGFRQDVLSRGNDSLAREAARLTRLMSVYGVTSDQTTVSGHRVVDVLQNELKRLVGTVEPPTLNTQVRQELNFIARQMEIRQEFFDGLDDQGTAATVSIEFGETSLEWGPPGQSGALLAPPATYGLDSGGNAVDVSQAGSGVYRLSSAAAPSEGSSAFDRNAGRLAAQGSARARPDLNQDGARNEADAAVGVVIVRDVTSRQAAAGIAQFVADFAVPIAVRGGEATPSRPQSFEDRDR